MEANRTICPKFERAFQIIGKKWNGLIIDVLLHGDTHFNRIAEAIPELSDRMLAARLRELEEAAIVERHVEARQGCPIQITYRLTEKGEEIKPILQAVHEWAEKWNILPQIESETN
ncbi:MAG: helix-turn-helix domain-containing protein [Sporolactobacillus sp.]